MQVTDRFKEWSRSPYMTYIPILLVACAFVYAIMPFPQDDFLRHVRFSEYEGFGGYSFMFPFSYFEGMNYSPWFGFDIITGCIASIIGQQNTVVLYEVMFFALFFIAILRNLEDRGDTSLSAIYIILIFLLMTVSISRIYLIRPATLLGIMFLILIKEKHWSWGFIITLFMGTMYWLFFIYTIPVALAHYIKGNKKYSLSILIGISASFIMWLAYTDLRYIELVSHIVATSFGGRDSIAINELRQPLFFVTLPVVFGLVFTFATTIYKKRNFDIFLWLIILTAPGAVMSRYFMDLTIPLVFIFVINNNSDVLRKLYSAYKPVVEATLIISVFLLVPPLIDKSYESQNTILMEGLELESGSVVFSDEMTINFNTVYFNKAPVRVLPSPEPGWNNKETIRLYKKINDEWLVDNDICSFAQRHTLNYVITEKDVKAECLKHRSTFRNAMKKREVSVWQVL